MNEPIDPNESADLYDPDLVFSAAAGALATPGEILTRLRIVDADVRSFDAEIQGQRAELPPAFVRGWNHWRDAWRRFFAENQAFVRRLWPGTLREVEAFARRLRDWRTAAERAGVSFSGPAPGRPPASTPLIRVPSLPSLPSLPHLPSLPGLPNVFPNPSMLLGPGAALLRPNGPLSSGFWQSVKPVAIAGAVVVSGIALVWIAATVRTAFGQAQQVERALPMLLGARLP